MSIFIFQLLLQIFSGDGGNFRNPADPIFESSIEDKLTGSIEYEITAGTNEVTAYGLIYQSGAQICPTGPQTLDIPGWTNLMDSSMSTIAPSTGYGGSMSITNYA